MLPDVHSESVRHPSVQTFWGSRQMVPALQSVSARQPARQAPSSQTLPAEQSGSTWQPGTQSSTVALQMVSSGQSEFWWQAVRHRN